MPRSNCSEGSESASSVAANIAGYQQPKSASGNSKDGTPKAFAIAEECQDDFNDSPIRRIPGVSKVYETIGKGEFSSVHRCRLDNYGDVAVKTFTLGANLRPVLFDLKRLRHPHLVSILQVNPHPVSVVLELCGITLFEALHAPHAVHGAAFRGLQNVEQRLRVGTDIVGAVDYLHRNEIIHRNISSTSCLASLTPGSEPSFKLGEFMLARDGGGGGAMTTWTGTFAYMAPEIMDDDSYSYPADVYSCGILLHEIASRKQPYGGSTNPRMMAQVIRGLRPDVAEVPELKEGDAGRCDKFRKLLALCWRTEPEDRPTAQQTCRIMEGAILHKE